MRPEASDPERGSSGIIQGQMLGHYHTARSMDGFGVIRLSPNCPGASTVLVMSADTSSRTLLKLHTLFQLFWITTNTARATLVVFWDIF